MKIFKTFIWVFTSILLLLFSCTKDKFVNSDISDEIGIGLTIDVGGITEEFETLAATTNSVQLNTDESPDLSKLVSFNDFDAIPTVTDLKPSATAKFTKSTKNKIASQTPMSNGIKYYLVLFEDNNGARGNFIGSYLLTAGVRKTISVEVGKKYHWKAYSYNSDANDLPSVSEGNYDVSMGENKDFLYASGITANISETTPTYLSVIFNRMLTRVGIEINAKGMFTDDIRALDADLILTDGSGLNLPFKIGNFDILDSVTTESDIPYSTNNFKLFSLDKSVSGNTTEKSNTVVAYLNIPRYVNENLRVAVRLNKLNIELDNEAKALNNNFREFNYTALSEQNRPIIYSENINILSSGKQKLLKVDLVESPLTITNRGYYYLIVLPVDYFNHEVQWARSNLYFNRSDDSYRFQHINNPSTKRESYFSWGSKDPFNYGKNEDPCSLVYPTGLWKMPSATDFYATIGGTVTDINLLNLIKLNLNLLGINLAGIYFPSQARNRTNAFTEYTPTTGQSDFYNVGDDNNINNKIRFNYNGFYANTSLVEQLIDLDLGQAGNISRIWTSTANADLLGLAGVGAISYSGTSLTDYMDVSLLNLLNINALGIDVAKTDLNNIRCVRNLEYARKNNN